MDHVSRIPNPCDYFVFEFGIWDSVILVHDKAGEVKGYHNMCRHRGSRLCTHDTKFDNVRPGQATEDGKPVDARLSVVQLGGSGNTPVFRCPYHAWTYDLSGALVSLPPGMPSGFDQANYGLYPCHVRTTEGFIFVSFAEGEPPDFAAFTAGLTRVAEAYGTPDLKLAARRSYTLTTNWKLALETMRECDHCQPSHTRSFAGTHMIYLPTAGRDERARVEREMVAHGHPVSPRDIGYMTLPDEDRLYQASNMTGSTSRRASTGGMGGSGATGSHFRLGFVTGSFDGRPVGPMLPKRQGPRMVASAVWIVHRRDDVDHEWLRRLRVRDALHATGRTEGGLGAVLVRPPRRQGGEGLRRRTADRHVGPDGARGFVGGREPAAWHQEQSVPPERGSALLALGRWPVWVEQVVYMTDVLSWKRGA